MVDDRAESRELRRNAVLAALPDAELDEVAARAEIVHMQVRDYVYQRSGLIEDVYFPLRCVCSFVAMVDDDETFVEVATIGNEGFVGLPAFLGVSTSPHAAFCQVPGRAARLPVVELRSLLSHDGQLRNVLNRYTQAALVQIAQNVACGRTHTTDARASRWILMTQDRVGSETFPLTQEFLAQMLAVRRPTVSLTAATLQAAGLIRYSRGQMTVIDRAGLEAAACGCYALIREETARLMGS